MGRLAKYLRCSLVFPTIGSPEAFCRHFLAGRPLSLVCNGKAVLK